MVPLLCVLDLSPTGRSPLEVTQRPLVTSGHPQFLVQVAPVRSRSVSGTFTWRVSHSNRVLWAFLLSCPVIALARCFTCNVCVCCEKKEAESSQTRLFSGASPATLNIVVAPTV